MVKWAFEYDEVSLLFPFKLPSFHTLSREKKTRLTPIFKSKQLRIMISCSQQETTLSQQTQTQRLTLRLEMGEGKRNPIYCKFNIFLLEMNFDKSTIGLHFLLISSILAKLKKKKKLKINSYVINCLNCKFL